MGTIGLGLFFLCVLGPVLAVPSLFNWKFRRNSYRVRRLASLIGEEGARWFYVLLGAFVAFLGFGFVAAGSWKLLVVVQPPQRDRAAPPSQFATHAGPFEWKDARKLFKYSAYNGKNAGPDHLGGVVFSPDGERCLNASEKLTAFGLGAETFHKEYTFAQLGIAQKLDEPDRIAARVSRIATSYDRRFVLFTLSSGTRPLPWIVRWNWDEPEKPLVLPLPADAGEFVAISADGQQGLVYYGPGAKSRGEPPAALRVDFVQERTEPLELRGHFAGADFLGKTYRIAAALENKVQIECFDVMENRQIYAAEIASVSPNDRATASFRVSGDGSWGVSCHPRAQDHKVRVWNLNDGLLLGEAQLDQNLSVRDCAVAPVGDQFVTVGESDPAIVIWRRPEPNTPPRRDKKFIPTSSAPSHDLAKVSFLHFTRDSFRLLAITDRGMCVWDERER